MLLNDITIVVRIWFHFVLSNYDMEIKHNFNKVIGIDLDKSAVEIAINNCTLMQKAGYKTTFEVLYSDASNYEIPYSINVIFLANPFGEATIKQVLGNIIDSCIKHQKELHLVYSAPFYQNVFTAFNENCTKLYEISNGKRASTCISVFKIHF